MDFTEASKDIIERFDIKITGQQAMKYIADCRHMTHAAGI